MRLGHVALRITGEAFAPFGSLRALGTGTCRIALVAISASATTATTAATATAWFTAFRSFARRTIRVRAVASNLTLRRGIAERVRLARCGCGR